MQNVWTPQKLEKLIEISVVVTHDILPVATIQEFHSLTLVDVTIEKPTSIVLIAFNVNLRNLCPTARARERKSLS